jgi:uncharacterized protein (UPF0264 family)
MRLLVSVSNAAEAAAALDGGADIIDAKDPHAGPLGAVTYEVLREIASAVGGRRPLTAALGDEHDCAALARAASTFVASGVELVKVGFAGIGSEAAVVGLLEAAVRGASAGVRPRLTPTLTHTAGVVATAYADAGRARSVTADVLLRAAARAGARGVLLDTFDKQGPGLRQLMPHESLSDWVRRAKDLGLLVAAAGRLSAGDLAWVDASGADVAGVRGAACEGGRAGRVTREHVRTLVLGCRELSVERPAFASRATAGKPERSERSERSVTAASPAPPERGSSHPGQTRSFHRTW